MEIQNYRWIFLAGIMIFVAGCGGNMPVENNGIKRSATDVTAAVKTAVGKARQEGIDANLYYIDSVATLPNGDAGREVYFVKKEQEAVLGGANSFSVLVYDDGKVTLIRSR